MNWFLEAVENEVARARAQHPWVKPTLHHGYGVLLEEVDEFWDEVKKKSENRDADAIVRELIQVAAVANRIAAEICRRDKGYPPTFAQAEEGPFNHLLSGDQ